MSTGKKKGLGRGLSALFGDEKTNVKTQVINKSNTVPISDLSRNPYQPRQHFSEEKLEELTNSIKKKRHNSAHSS
jgi:ParB family chromosome partitioning protein